MKICNFVNSNIELKNDILNENEGSDDEEKNEVYYEIYFNPELIIHSDIKISISGGVNFYVWVNLYYSSWETIKTFYDETFKIYNNNNNNFILDTNQNINDGFKEDSEINTSKKKRKI